MSEIEIIDDSIYKKCTECDIERKLDEFNKSDKYKDGHIKKCKHCVKKCKHKYYIDNLEKVKSINKKYYLENKKSMDENSKIYRENNKEKLSESAKIYRENNKENSKKYSKKYREDNKEYYKEYNKKYREDNKDSITKRKKSYYEKNKEAISKRHKIYYEKNKEKIIESVMQYANNNKEKVALNQKKWRKEHPHISTWRKTLKNTLNRMGLEKTEHTIDMLGYSPGDLKIHMEYLFTEGMSWDNHGEWHIDHKIPLTAFDSSTPMSIVNSLENLQPMWSFDNISKSNKIFEEYKNMNIYIKYCTNKNNI